MIGHKDKSKKRAADQETLCYHVPNTFTRRLDKEIYKFLQHADQYKHLIWIIGPHLGLNRISSMHDLNCFKITLVACQMWFLSLNLLTSKSLTQQIVQRAGNRG